MNRRTFLLATFGASTKAFVAGRRPERGKEHFRWPLALVS